MAAAAAVEEGQAPQRWRKRSFPSLLALLLALALASLVFALPDLLHRPFFLLPPSSSSSSSSCASSLLPFSSAAFHGDLRSLPSAWNFLSLSSSSPPPALLHIALFVKKWPFGSSPGGLERHAQTLHLHLADRGHSVHVFTVSPDSASVPQDYEESSRIHFHLYPPTIHGRFDIVPAWEKFLELNASRAFDIVHTESVALPFQKAHNLSNVVASWHGIAYEIIHSDVVRDLNRKPGEARSLDLQKSLSERVLRVVEEVKFFHSYKHHVATSDYVGDVLRTIYEIPLENVHIILNGVDPQKYRPDPARGAAFRDNFGVPRDARLVLGAAGRLVKDKGYPLLFEAFSELIKEYRDVYLLVAGDGPWADRFRELAPNVKVLGPLAARQLSDFYNALDVFVNPTLRSQGLDHTLLEAMLCGKPLLATHFSSITRSVIVNKDMGYTFSANTASLISALRLVILDGKDALEKKGQMCFRRASLLFTASKMGSAYERLFLCIKNDIYCNYPMQSDI